MTHCEMTANEARRNWAALIGAAEYRGESTVITRYSRPVAVVGPIDLLPQENNMTTSEILDRLNTYEATHDKSAISGSSVHNVWDDIILNLDDYDEDRTEQVEHGSGDAFALTDGTVIEYDEQAGQWRES